MKFKVPIFVLVQLFIIEAGLRIFGFCNAPLFYTSDLYEYMYLPNQNRMRFGNQILINEHSMRSYPLYPKDSIKFLLIGDSVIDGGVMTTHEDLAATMLASTLGIPFNPDQAWDERKQVYKASEHIFKTRNVCQSAQGNKDGLWTTVLVAAVFIT